MVGGLRTQRHTCITNQFTPPSPQNTSPTTTNKQHGGSGGGAPRPYKPTPTPTLQHTHTPTPNNHNTKHQLHSSGRHGPHRAQACPLFGGTTRPLASSCPRALTSQSFATRQHNHIHTTQSPQIGTCTQSTQTHSTTRCTMISQPP